MPFEPIGNKLRNEEKVSVLLTNLFVINIIASEALRQTDEFVLVYQIYCLWRRDASYWTRLPSGGLARQTYGGQVLDAG